ncbi:unnamed protein product [Spirodela intermedia]|uniref:tRNA:m(4)X modification enzyme TRM13 n=1 Tax=Spirodela intermedia TaxID=51605 RepID=A0A7I8IWL1_SPIIN|nr:unnamed protein product [Spirodela intermedia]CAA6662161.1 unnamed protein product [Spirodela intermedia]
MDVAEQRPPSPPAPQQRRCQFWMPSKVGYAPTPLCTTLRTALLPLCSLLLSVVWFCGNHNPATDEQRIPCPIDPSHSVLKRNLDSHIARCPVRKHALELEAQPFYKKGVNCGGGEGAKGFVRSEAKRSEIYRLTVPEFLSLVQKIKAVYSSLPKEIYLRESFISSQACAEWLEGRRGEDGQQLPFRRSTHCKGGGSAGEEGKDQAVVEFGAGRGYLTQMLADCYGIRGVYLVERRSYKLKADRSLRQKDGMSLERLRIDIEDLNLNGVESLRGRPYLAIGKHLCGPATDLTLRCCLRGDDDDDDRSSGAAAAQLSGLAVATCCHHLCQWDQYITVFFRDWDREEEFNAITWFSSWAVDGAHNLGNSHGGDQAASPYSSGGGGGACGVEEVVKRMSSGEKACLGFVCKEIIDVGRLMWLRGRGLKAELVKYVPVSVSPENHLLLAR